MKIVLVNTYDSGGGAAIACRRLAKALAGEGHQVTILVNYKKGNAPNTVAVNDNGIGKLFTFLRFSFERFSLLFYLKSKKELYAFSSANSGTDLTDHPVIKEADVVHIHWINQGFMSIDDLGKLAATDKPLVWTLHDMWTFTGGCHYSGSCNYYQHECGNCPYLRNPAAGDLSNQIWHHKQRLLAGKIQYITCSGWLNGVAKSSGLLKSENVVTIPNAIDATVFQPLDKKACRRALKLTENKIQVLFGSANIKDERKGFIYLKEALEIIRTQNPDFLAKIEVMVFGKADETFASQLPVKTNFLGTINSESEMAKVYSAADMFVIPSLQDNLPNTIMESLACGTPVVGFKTGGIPEMIDHQMNGYLADYKSATDLAKGMEWSTGNHLATQSTHARNKVLNDYAEPQVAKAHLQLYQQVINAKR